MSVIRTRDEIRDDDVTIDVIKWMLFICNVFTLILTIIIFKIHLPQRDQEKWRFWAIMVHCVFGFFLLIFGSYAAVNEHEKFLIVYASLLLINIAIAIFVKHHMQMCTKINLTLYTVCAMIGFIEAYHLKTLSEQFSKYKYKMMSIN